MKTLPAPAVSLLLLGLLLAPAGMVFAQPPPGITENPEGAVRLRTLWVKTGSGSDSTIVGIGYGAIGDVNGDNYDDVAVTRELQWGIYLGGPSMSIVPDKVITTEAINFGPGTTPVVGRFFGGDSVFVGLRDSRCTPGNGVCYYQMRFYRPDPDSLLIPTGLILDPGLQPASANAMAADLDGDGDDELVFVNREDRDAVVRIYEGGPDFSLDVPNITMRWVDTTASAGAHLTYYSSIALHDQDGFPDLVLAKLNGVSGMTATSYWWGSPQAIKNRSLLPDRVDYVESGKIGQFPNYALIPEDLDGDKVAEVFGLVQTGEKAGTYVWFTRGRESSRTRAFTEETFDQYYPGAIRNRGFGFVADSLQRYEMMVLRNPVNFRDAYGLGGGYDGPNRTYDADFGGSDGPAFGGVDAGDVDNNGWRDRLIASETYGGPGVGRAVIVAGGPYIPVDDPTVSVESAPVAGEPTALHLWPNPVTDNLHVAWRGDLPRMPHLMQIYNALGELVEERGLPTWKGTTTWSAAGHPAGAYTIVIFDAGTRQLGTIPFILQP